MSSSSFGLHVGNTTACLAVNKDGSSSPIVVANDAGERVTPSAVAFPDGVGGGGEVLTGISARQFLTRHPHCGVSKGHRRAQNGETDAVGAATHKDKGGSAWYEIVAVEEGMKGGKVTAAEIDKHILGNMHKIALSHAASESPDDLRTVVAVPRHFNSEQRSSAAAAADRAGFNVVQVISEEASACLAYGLGQLDPADRFHAAVVRIGGLTTSASIVHVSAGMLTVVATAEREDVGGDRITALMVDFLAAEFQRKYKCDPREGRRSRQKLQTHAETVKHVLSTMDTAKCYIESLHEGIDFNMNVSRARFENEVSKALPELMAPVREALEASGLAADAVEKVVLVGGSAKIPRIQKAVGDIFDSAEVLASISADEVIAVGAATQASIMEEKILAFAEEKAIDVKVMNATISFAVVLKGSSELVLQELIPRFSPAPIRKSAMVEVEAAEAEAIAFFAVVEDGAKVELAKLPLPQKEGASRVGVSAHVHRDADTLRLGVTDKAGDGQSHHEDVSLRNGKA